MAGQNYEIICDVCGAENLNSTVTYHWIKNNEIGNMNSKTLSFTPVRVSDAGTSYSCSATIVSSYLMGHNTAHTVVSPRSELIIQSKFKILILLIYCYF